MRHREGAVSDHARRPRVRWEDQEGIVDQQHESASTRVRQLPPSLRLRSSRGSLASEPLASQSAAVTLSMYLSDALGDDTRAKQGDVRPPVIRRLEPRMRNSLDTSSGDVEAPGSPLTRFLRKRSQVSLVPSARELLRVAPTASRQELFVRAAPFPSLTSHAGSMERILMEKIHEAKRMRQHRTNGQENKPPTNDAVPPPSPPPINRLSEIPYHASTDVPIPHAKPQKPVLASVALCTSSETQRLKLPSVELPSAKHASPVEVALAATRAAHHIQRAWRSNRLQRRQLEEKEKTDVVLKKDRMDDVEFTACGGDITTSQIQTNDAAEETEAHSKIDSEPSPVTNLCEQDEAFPMAMEVNSARAVRWLDDECVFLEEGRFPTYELLDVSAHQDDQSLETLVWTKPHVVAAMQESTRRELDRARRAQRRQRVERIQDIAEDAIAPSFVAMQTARQQLQGRPQLQRRRRRTRIRVVLPKKRRHKFGGRRIQIGYCPRADTTSKLSASMSSRIESTDDPAKLLSLEPSRYVVFSTHEPRDSAPRNDLIGVGGQDAAAMSPRDDEDEEKTDSEGSEAHDGVDLMGTTSSVPVEDDSAAVSSVDQGETAERGVVTSANISISSSTIQGDCLDEFQVEMRDVEMQIHHCTLDGSTSLQSSQLYSQDQQRLIDAYATDAVLTTFFSPPPSPVDSYGDGDQSQVQTLTTTSSNTSPRDDDQASTASSQRPTLDAWKQQEFLQALDDFRQSLRSSMASTPRTGSDGLLFPTTGIALDLQEIPLSVGDVTTLRGSVHSSISTNNTGMEDKGEDLDSDDNDDAASSTSGDDMDAELQAMLMEIQRCKTQIASARRLPAVPAHTEP